MKNSTIKRNLLALICLLIPLLNFAQYTYTTQPNAANGKDAIISEANTSNLGTNPQLWALAWTYGGSNNGRGLVQFDLSPIPSNAIITDARLSLWAWNQSGGAGSHSQNQGDNAAYIERITSSWQEMTVLWSNKPSTTTLHRDSLEGTTNPALNYPNINVTKLVIDMIQYGNYGFMLREKIEAPFHKLNFCSSDHNDSTKHPKLVVSYITIDILKNDVSCHGFNNGTAKVVVGGNLNNVSYLWSTGALTDSIGGLSPGTYTVMIHYTPTDSILKSITINTPPAYTINTSNGAVICQGDSILLTASTNGYTTYNYFWNNNLPNGSQHKVAPQYSTIYTVYAVDSNNCYSDTSMIIVGVNPKPQPSLGADRIIFQNDSIKLDPGTFASYLWSTGDTTQSIMVYGNSLPIGNHKYIVEVENQNNCTAKDSIAILIANSIQSVHQDSNFKIYPNPTSSWFNISNDKSIYINNVLIFDAQGKLIIEERIESNRINIRINIDKLSRGQYYILIQTKKGNIKRQLSVK
jgi:hypothetical protein